MMTCSDEVIGHNGVVVVESLVVYGDSERTVLQEEGTTWLP